MMIFLNYLKDINGIYMQDCRLNTEELQHILAIFFLEPEYTGMTHTLSSRIDGGNIFHQTSIKLNKNYGIHDNSCQAVKEFMFDLPKVINFVSKSHKKNFGH